MNPTQLIIAGVLSLAASAAAAHEPDWSVSGSIGAVTDYRDRGYTLSDGEAAIQGEVTLAHGSGVYAGVWGSSIADYGVDAEGEGAEFEMTLYGGWAGEVGGFEVDLGVWQNLYPGGEDVNYVEFPVEAARAFGDARLSAGLIWAPAQTGLGDEANTYAWTRAEYAPASWPVAVHAGVGHEDGGFAPDGKTDWRIGLEAPIGPVVLGLDWVDSDTEDSAAVGRVFWNF